MRETEARLTGLVTLSPPGMAQAPAAVIPLLDGTLLGLCQRPAGSPTCDSPPSLYIQDQGSLVICFRLARDPGDLPVL